MTKYEILTIVLSSLAFLLSLAVAIYQVVIKTKAIKKEKVNLYCELALRSSSSATFRFVLKLSNKSSTACSISKLLVNNQVCKMFLNKERVTHFYLNPYETQEIEIWTSCFDEAIPVSLEVFTPIKNFSFEFSPINKLPSPKLLSMQ